MFDFVWSYALPMLIFAYCYSRIFHKIRSQSKLVRGHVQVVPMSTTSRDHNSAEMHHETGNTTGTKLSRTEKNVLRTVIAIIVSFIIFWTPSTIGGVAYIFVKVCLTILGVGR